MTQCGISAVIMILAQYVFSVFNLFLFSLLILHFKDTACCVFLCLFAIRPLTDDPLHVPFDLQEFGMSSLRAKG